MDNKETVYSDLKRIHSGRVRRIKHMGHKAKQQAKEMGLGLPGHVRKGGIAEYARDTYAQRVQEDSLERLRIELGVSKEKKK